MKLHMYGSGKAAHGWHCKYADTMEELEFRRGQSYACSFWHAEKQMASSVHGDDFTTAGAKSAPDWFRAEFGKKYELKEAARMGPARGDAKEGRVLNRIVHWTKEGLT